MQSAVKISDVTFSCMYGTAATKIAVDLICSDSIGCTNIVLNDINITSAIPGTKTYALCNNAQGFANSNCTPIVPCLSH